MPTKAVSYKLLKALQEAAGKRHDSELNDVLEALYLRPDEEDAEHTQLLAEQFDLEAKLLGRLVHPFLPSPLPDLLNGDITMGTLPWYRERVCLPLFGHKYICGATGVGKSTLVKVLILAALERGLRVVVFDPEGQFGPELAAAVPRGDVYCVDPASYLVNPYDPPAPMPQREWLGWMANIDREVWWYRKNTQNFTNNSALEVLDSGRPLTLRSLHDHVLRRMPKHRFSPEYDSWERVKTTLEALMLYSPGLTVESSRGLEEMLSRALVIFDWHRLADAQHRKYLTLHVLSWILASRNDEFGSYQPMLLVLDEVSQLASTEVIHGTDILEPLFEQALRRSAKRNISITTIDQNPAFTHPVVRANSAVKVVMRLDEGRDKRLMADDLDLNPEQRAWFSRLGFRQALVKLPTLDPFLADIPEIKHAD